jgi:hypothetical protein
MQAAAINLELNDALLGIFVLAKRNHCHGKKLELNIHNYQIHEIFRSIQERVGSTPILDRFIFSDSGPIPFSPPLEQVLFDLQCSGLTTRPDVQRWALWALTESGERYFQEIEKNIPPQTMKELAQIADYFIGRVRPN